MKPLKAADRSADSRLRATVVGRKSTRTQRQEGSRRREASWIPAKGKLCRGKPQECDRHEKWPGRHREERSTERFEENL
jgi:hypothetical protein